MRRSIVHIIFFVLLFCAPSRAETAFSRNALIQDTRQIVELIESIHPDPYVRGGGKIAFHRRLHCFLNSIPDSGWSRDRYAAALLPFLASIGDGHTYLIPPYWQSDDQIAIPLAFSVVEKKLYVSGVYSSNHRSLLNCVLKSIEGVPVSDLALREKKILAFENEYHNLTRLIYRLQRPATLSLLIPQWKNKKTIKAAFETPKGRLVSVKFLVRTAPRRAKIIPDSQVQMPNTTSKDFNFRFMNSSKSTVLLSITDMQTYRECHEHWRFYGNHHNYEALARKTFERYQHKVAPAEINQVIAGLPAATDCFREMVIAMREAKTKNLFIDLRENPGGVSNIAEILLYFLFGRDRIAEINARSYQIRKHSKLFYDIETGETFIANNNHRKTPLMINDYDFLEEQLLNDPLAIERRRSYYLNQLNEMASHMPTFEQEYKTGKYEKYYTPKNIVAITSAQTFSSAFWLLSGLFKLGAKVVGTPSGQAPNTFSDQYPFKLKNTGLTLHVTCKYSVTFPDLPEEADVLMPHYLMTYEKLKHYDFDPNATIRWAQDIYRDSRHAK